VRGLVTLVGFAWLGFLALMAAVADPLLARARREPARSCSRPRCCWPRCWACQLAALGTALVLVILAGLAGGAPAAVAVTGFLATLGFYLAFDHALRKLQLRPTSEARLLGPISRGAARMVAPVALVLTLAFVAAPPTRSAPSGIGDARPEVAVEQVRRAYLWLFLLALGGGAAVLGWPGSSAAASRGRSSSRTSRPRSSPRSCSKRRLSTSPGTVPRGPGGPGLSDLPLPSEGRRLRDRGAPDARRDRASGGTTRGAARGS